MDHDLQHLLDILAACDQIISYTAGMDPNAFEIDDRTRSAVNYQLIVVGEAANRVSDERQLRYASAPWRLAIETRNFFAHQYAGLNQARIWQTATVSIPTFRAQIVAILAAEFPGSEQE